MQDQSNQIKSSSWTVLREESDELIMELLPVQVEYVLVHIMLAHLIVHFTSTILCILVDGTELLTSRLIHDPRTGCIFRQDTTGHLRILTELRFRAFRQNIHLLLVEVLHMPFTQIKRIRHMCQILGRLHDILETFYFVRSIDTSRYELGAEPHGLLILIMMFRVRRTEVVLEQSRRIVVVLVIVLDEVVDLLLDLIASFLIHEGYVGMEECTPSEGRRPDGFPDKPRAQEQWSRIIRNPREGVHIIHGTIQPNRGMGIG